MTDNKITRRSEVRRNYKDLDLAIKAIEENQVSLEEFINYGSSLVFGQKFMDKYKNEIESSHAMDMLLHKFNILSEYELVGKYISITLTNSIDGELDNIIKTLMVILRSQYYYNKPIRERYSELPDDIYINMVNTVNDIYTEYIDIIIDYLTDKDIKVPINVLNTRQLFK